MQRPMRVLHWNAKITYIHFLHRPIFAHPPVRQQNSKNCFWQETCPLSVLPFLLFGHYFHMCLFFYIRRSINTWFAYLLEISLLESIWWECTANGAYEKIFDAKMYLGRFSLESLSGKLLITPPLCELHMLSELYIYRYINSPDPLYTKQ